MNNLLRWLLPWMLCGSLLGSDVAAPSDQQIADWIQQLAADSFETREAATRALIRNGNPLRDRFEQELLAAGDPETRHRLKYILSNVTPPQSAALLLSASKDSGLRPGDVITHVNGRVIRSAGDLRQRLEASSFGLMLRVRRPDGTQELGPIEGRDLQELGNYVAPRGAAYARILRNYHAGKSLAALRELQQLREAGPIGEDELPAALRACIWFTAGMSTAARELLIGYEELARPVYGGQPWDSPSGLDRLLGSKSPYQLEWTLYTEAGTSFQRSQVDYDLRMQRILEPSGRYLTTCVRALQIWYEDLRDDLIMNGGNQHVAGNTLAVAGWMLYDLGLRDECCQLIEPRSILLRRSNNGPRKWVRVDTDAWLPYLKGSTKEAVDSFYEYAFAVLADPPNPADVRFVIQNPTVAARIAFFLYQLPEDKRIDELAAQVIREKHPILPEYTRWMLQALQHDNLKMIRRDMQQALPLLTGADGRRAACDVALLEYLQETPQREVFLAAEERLPRDNPDNLVWLAVVQALERLVANQPLEAQRRLEAHAGHPLARSLYHTARFRAVPPAAAAFHDVLRDPLLAVPLLPKDAAWLVLTRQRRLLRFDVASEELRPIDAPTEEWFPNPRTWPWVSSDPEAQRGWVYARRRLVEVQADGALGIRLNIQSDLVQTLEGLIGPAFGELVEVAEDRSSLALPRSGAFLEKTVQAHRGMISDPELPEISIADRLPRDPRVARVVLRGGQQLLLVPATGDVVTTRWMAQQIGEESLRCFARATATSAQREHPQLWIFSNHGLLRLDFANRQLERFPLPGNTPHPPVIPESVPYERTEPEYLYCARLPKDGGQVYRLQIEKKEMEALDLTNLALPGEYFPTLSRAEIRGTIDQQLEQAGLPPLAEIIMDADQVVRSLGAE